MSSKTFEARKIDLAISRLLVFGYILSQLIQVLIDLICKSGIFNVGLNDIYRNLIICQYF